MRLTLEKLRHAFLESGYEKFYFSTGWVLINHATKNGYVDLLEALTLVRNQEYEVTVFVEQILQTSDLDDVNYVIEKLISDTDYRFQTRTSLRMLQAWRASALMHIVIDKRRCVQTATK